MTHWRCISGCGACCRLDPSLRGEDLDRLSDDQQRLYLAMVGEDGWCVHYDTGGRRCRIYDTRPDFCRVENLTALFSGPGAAPEEVSPVEPAQEPRSGVGSDSGCLEPAAQALAIASCRIQIRAEYGGRGRVMRRFEQAIRRTP
jgi:hypothetical protein